MKKKVYALSAALALTGFLGGMHPAEAAFDENLNVYTLDAVVVEAEKTKNQFGDTITEQSYYRTGGDVKVITREEIEKRHYTDVTEAIKRIPGVTFTNAGYRGGEYGFNAYNNSMSINGDSRVIVLVDGRRVDNAVSTRFGAENAKGTRTMVDLNQVVSMSQVDKIEVMKGPGASAYGSDSTGGVINIITRKGSKTAEGTVDLATGSRDKHVYSLTYSGSAGDDHSWKYFLSANRSMAGDIKYHDGITGEDHIYTGTSYKEEGVSFRLDKEFDNGQNLKIWYGHQNGKDHYPITARDWRYWSEADWNRIIERTTRPGGFGNTDNPGYRNLFSLDALSGSYNAYRNNDLDISYIFGKDNGMESFIRAYRQKHHYWGVDRYPDWIDEKDGSYVPFPDSPAWENFIKNYKFPNGYNPTTTYVEENKGIQLQYGKSIGNHDVLTAVTFDKANMEKNKYNRNDKTWTKTTVERKSIFGFVQDKIHVSDKWDITPSIRYSHYSDYTGGVYDNKGNGTIVTPSLATQYAFDDTFSGYIGWNKVYRPIKAKDYTLDTPNGKPLEDEEGNVWTIGLNKRLSENTTIGVHYNLIDMSNAIVYYNVRKKGSAQYKEKAVNAKEKKKAFNVTLDHKFNNNWNLSLAYTHLYDKYTPKDGMEFDPDLGLDKSSNVNAQINKLRPTNHYIANLSYEKDKWYTGLLVNWYTGCNTKAFTHRRALVLDWNLNYEVNDSLSTYLTVTNLTNQAYENAYSAYNGLGAAPQPGRAWMIGAKYKF